MKIITSGRSRAFLALVATGSLIGAGATSASASTEAKTWDFHVAGTPQMRSDIITIFTTPTASFDEDLDGAAVTLSYWAASDPHQSRLGDLDTGIVTVDNDNYFADFTITVPAVSECIYVTMDFEDPALAQYPFTPGEICPVPTPVITELDDSTSAELERMLVGSFSVSALSAPWTGPDQTIDWIPQGSVTWKLWSKATTPATLVSEETVAIDSQGRSTAELMVETEGDHRLEWVYSGADSTSADAYQSQKVPQTLSRSFYASAPISWLAPETSTAVANSATTMTFRLPQWSEFHDAEAQLSYDGKVLATTLASATDGASFTFVVPPVVGCSIPLTVDLVTPHRGAPPLTTSVCWNPSEARVSNLVATANAAHTAIALSASVSAPVRGLDGASQRYVPTGAIDYTLTSSDGTRSTVSAPISPAGTASTTAPLPSGRYTVAATFRSSDATSVAARDASGAPQAVAATVLLKKQTVLTLRAEKATTTVVQAPPVLTATVDGDADATGLVTFFDGTHVLGTAPLTNGTATFTPPALELGSHSFTAAYAGDAAHFAATSEISTVVVTKAPVKMSVSQKFVGNFPGAAGTLTTRVCSAVSSSAAPRGAVTVALGSWKTKIATPRSTSGHCATYIATATLPLKATRVAASASYVGSATYLAGTATSTAVKATPLSTKTTVLSAPSSARKGSATVVTVTVAASKVPAGAGKRVPTGKVQLLIGGKPSGVAVNLSQGKARLKVPTSQVRTLALSARFIPSTATYAPSNAAAKTIKVIR